MATVKGLLMASLAPLAIATSSPYLPPDFENLVTFGDSYTDEGRLNYMIANGLEQPPPGTLLPESNGTASGGYVWPRFVAQKTGVKTLNYAIGGATSSDKIVEELLEGIAFPTVLEAEVPTFLADLDFEEELYGRRTANNTVYALWIGTNDIGINGFLSDASAEGTTLTSLVESNWDLFDQIYQTGGRRFVALNVVPLQHAPLYNIPELGGAVESPLWPNKTATNATEHYYRMIEYSTSVNTMLNYGTAFHGETRWPGATFSILDVHSLMTDVIASPEEYLQSPTELTEYYRHCKRMSMDCSFEEGPMDRYVWFDELHPSERIEEEIAKEFIQVLAGDSKYGATYKF